MPMEEIHNNVFLWLGITAQAKAMLLRVSFRISPLYLRIFAEHFRIFVGEVDLSGNKLI